MIRRRKCSEGYAHGEYNDGQAAHRVLSRFQSRRGVLTPITPLKWRPDRRRKPQPHSQAGCCRLAGDVEYGYALDQIQELADADGVRTKELLRLCPEHGIHVVGGSVAEKRGDEVYNTIHTFDRKGEQSGSYLNKIHLFRLMQEEKHLAGRHRAGTVPAGG